MSEIKTPSGPHTLLSADVTHDPYPLYRAIRACSPVYFDPQFKRWLVTGYDEVKAMLSDLRFSSTVATRAFGASEVGAQSPIGRYLASTMLTNDPPKHTRLRNLVSKAFTPGMMERLRAKIQHLTDALLDKVQPDGRMEVMRDLAYPLPLQVIIELVGADLEMAAPLQQWTSDLVRLVGTPNPLPEMLATANQSVVERNNYFLSIADRRRSQPRDDLITALVNVEEGGDQLTDEEICGTCGLLLGAGHETTSNLIGSGLLALLRHPDQLARLRAEPGLTGSAIEEFIRYDGPGQWGARLVLDEAEVGGVRFSPGEVLLLGLGAANRDPEHFTDPDVLDIGRQPNRHLGFGHGIHFCLGAALARIEAQIAFQTTLRRMPELRLEGTEPEWQPSLFIRGLKALPVAF